MIFQTLCLICGIDIGVSEEDLTIYEITPPNYCQNCGQVLVWSDSEYTLKLKSNPKQSKFRVK